MVIPSGVEAATQPRKLSGRGQAFNPVAVRCGNDTRSVDFLLRLAQNGHDHREKYKTRIELFDPGLKSYPADAV